MDAAWQPSARMAKCEFTSLGRLPSLCRSGSGQALLEGKAHMYLRRAKRAAEAHSLSEASLPLPPNRMVQGLRGVEVPVSPGSVAANTCWSPALTGEAFPFAVSQLLARAWPVLSLSAPSSFSRSERQLSLHQAEALAAGPLATIGLDVSPSTLIPFYDVDTSVAFFTGKVSQEGRGILPLSGQGLWGHVQGSKAGHPACNILGWVGHKDGSSPASSQAGYLVCGARFPTQRDSASPHCISPGWVDSSRGTGLARCS